MRTSAIVLGAMLSILAVPPVDAAHYGPCTHEWAEVPGYVVGAYKKGGVRGAAQAGQHVANYCVLQWIPDVSIALP